MLAGQYPAGTFEKLRAILPEEQFTLTVVDTQEAYDAMTDAEIMILRIFKAPREVIARNPNLRMILCWGAVWWTTRLWSGQCAPASWPGPGWTVWSGSLSPPATRCSPSPISSSPPHRRRDGAYCESGIFAQITRYSEKRKSEGLYVSSVQHLFFKQGLTIS